MHLITPVKLVAMAISTCVLSTVCSFQGDIIVTFAALLGCPFGFDCDNGQCTASVGDRCNNVTDCLDGSDEINCSMTEAANSKPYPCRLIGIIARYEVGINLDSGPSKSL